MRGLVAVFTMVMILGPLTAAAAVEDESSDRLTLEDIFDLEMVSDPQISPDGERIVYVREFADVMSDRRYSNLWIVDFDGGNHRPLTTGQARDTTPRWSPSGDRLAYVSDREGTSQLFLRFLDSGESARLTRLQSPPSSLAWSPDGKWISFHAVAPGKAPEVGRFPTPPPGAEWAEPARVIDRVVYRFDQVGYLPHGRHHVFVVPAEGGTARQVTSGDFDHGGPGLRPGRAVWTPEGTHLILSANRRADAALEPLDSEVWEFSVADGRARALTDRSGPDASAVVSPDGSRIAYVGFDDRYQGYQRTALYVMERDGSRPRMLSDALDRSVESPLWSPDGRGVYVLYDDRGERKLAWVGLDGVVETVADGVGGGGSAYTGGGFSLAKNGRFAITYSDPHVPGDVAVGERGKKGVRVVTAVNEDLLGHKRLAHLEEIWYESSKDGREIQGWVLKPPGFDPGRKYPLILEIHGGPFAAYGPTFDLEKQLMAAAGYVVLYTNPRGSTSYGEEFGNLIHHAYPGDDFYDLDSGVDAVLAKGYVDSENLFVTGGSGGGVLTSWMVGRSRRFRAAVTVYPVINWYSWVLTADVSAFGWKYWFPALPWDDPAHYESRSLLSVVKNVTTPTMVLTGEEDYRTPMSESEQYYKALKLLGVDSVLVRVPNEPHGIRRRPSHHAQKVASILGWFERYRQQELQSGESTGR